MEYFQPVPLSYTSVCSGKMKWTAAQSTFISSYLTAKYNLIHISTSRGNMSCIQYYYMPKRKK